MWACVINKMKICKMLLNHGANINHADINGFTALSHAARGNHYKLCKLFIRRGAQVRGSGISFLENGLPTVLAERYEGELLDVRGCPIRLSNSIRRLIEKTEFMVLDAQPNVMVMKIATIKNLMRSHNIYHIAQTYLLQEALPEDIVRTLKQKAYVKLTTFITDVPQGGLNTLRRMKALANEKRNYTPAERQLLRQWQQLKHPIEILFQQLVAPLRGVFRSLTTVLKSEQKIRHQLEQELDTLRHEMEVAGILESLPEEMKTRGAAETLLSMREPPEKRRRKKQHKLSTLRF